MIRNAHERQLTHHRKLVQARGTEMRRGATADTIVASQPYSNPNHRRVKEEEEELQQQQQQPAVSATTTTEAVRHLEAVLLWCALLAAVTFAVANDFRVAVFDIQGLAGAFIDLKQPLTGDPASTQNSKRGYSMTSIVRELPGQTSRSVGDEGVIGRGVDGHPVSASLCYFAILLCITCLAAPAASVLLACLVSGSRWLSPAFLRRYGLQFLGHRSHDAALRSMLDTTLAWCGLDVLALACIAGWWQIDLIAQWLVEDQFGEQCKSIRKNAGVDCISVQTDLLQGFWWMTICALACLSLSAVVTRMNGLCSGLLSVSRLAPRS